MSNNLNDIVDIQIQIASPATSLSGFESILIVGPEPASKTLEDYKPLGVYTSLEGVKAAGWAEGDAVYDAAAVAFAYIFLYVVQIMQQRLPFRRL